jgi:hypothetical protein
LDLGDIYRPSQKIEEDIEFQRGISVKKNLEELWENCD